MLVKELLDECIKEEYRNKVRVCYEVGGRIWPLAETEVVPMKQIYIKLTI